MRLPRTIPEPLPALRTRKATVISGGTPGSSGSAPKPTDAHRGRSTVTEHGGGASSHSATRPLDAWGSQLAVADPAGLASSVTTLPTGTSATHVIGSPSVAHACGGSESRFVRLVDGLVTLPAPVTLTDSLWGVNKAATVSRSGPMVHVHVVVGAQRGSLHCPSVVSGPPSAGMPSARSSTRVPTS